MKAAYQYRFTEAGREYQVILSVDGEGKPEVIETKRLAPWIGSGPGITSCFRKINSKDGLSQPELEKLIEAGVDIEK